MNKIFVAFLLASYKYFHTLWLLQKFNIKLDQKQINPCTKSVKSMWAPHEPLAPCSHDSSLSHQCHQAMKDRRQAGRANEMG